jgi:hypothetical protein
VVRGRRATSPLYHFSRGPERCPLYLDEQVSRSESVGSAKCQMPVRRNSAHILGCGLRGNHAVATLMFRAIEPLIGDTQCVDFLSNGSSEGRDLGLRSYRAARTFSPSFYRDLRPWVLQTAQRSYANSSGPSMQLTRSMVDPSRRRAKTASLRIPISVCLANRCRCGADSPSL